MSAMENSFEIFRRWINDFLFAVEFLSRIPVPKNDAFANRPLAEVVWAFPLVGVIIGGSAGLVFLVMLKLGLTPLVCGLFAVITQIFITGGLHEDGIADVADGFGGGHALGEKLKIMRDSQLGTYGVLALVSSFIIRAGLIAGMTTPIMSVLALMTAGAVSRSLVVLAMNKLEMVRKDGLAIRERKPKNEAMYSAMGLGATLAFIFLGANGWVVLAVAFTTTIMVCALANYQIGGQTGDVLGAVQQISEIAVLISIITVL